MAAKSYMLDDAIIEFFLRANGGGVTSPASLEAALYTVAPTAGSMGTEVSNVGTAYAPQPITFAASVNGQTANNATVTFPTATLSWGVVVAAAIRDGATHDILYFGNLSAPKTIDPGDTASFAVSSLTVQEQ
jgi:hypothetical protein